MKKKKKLFVIADSISMHYGPYLKKYIASEFDYSRKGEGNDFGNIDDVSVVNGGDSACVLKYLKHIISEGFQTDVLLLNCGLHDIKTIPATKNKQVPLENYIENLKEITELLTKHKIKTMWVRTTPANHEIHKRHCGEFWRFDEDVVTYNSEADKIMEAAGIESIDLYAFTNNLDEDLYCDHIHFNENVRKLQAAFISGHLV